MSVQTDIKLIDNATKVLANINKEANKLNEIIEEINGTSITPKDGSTTESMFSNLVGSGKNFLGTMSQASMVLYGVQEVVGGISRTIGTLANYSDTLSETTARLNLMNDGLMSTDMLWSEIYESAMRSRGSVIDTADAVAKMGIVTKGVFSSNEELVQFTENLTKSFKIAGTSTQGISSAMLQLTQAMSSGVLRGEELNSIFENAPLLIQNIADYIDVPIGQIRELASEGQITADILKNAILGATDDINTKFEEMPMKFEELGTQFANVWYDNLRLVQDDISSIPQELSNSLLPVWDAFTYGLFTDLSNGQQEFTNEIKNTTGILDVFAQEFSNVAGEVITKNEAMKILFVANMEVFESLMKKTGNLILETGDFVIDTIDWLFSSLVHQTVSSINEIAKAIDSLTKGMTNFSSTTSGWVQTWGNKKAQDWNNMNTYENRLGDNFFGTSVFKLQQEVTDRAIENVLNDKKRVSDALSSASSFKSAISTDREKTFGTVDKISRDVSDISKGISNLNDLNKSIMEINEATYHNNVANQFSGNIQIVAYGTGEEEQKAIGKATEDAIRRVFLNDFQNTQAMGVYA